MPERTSRPARTPTDAGIELWVPGPWRDERELLSAVRRATAAGDTRDRADSAVTALPREPRLAEWMDHGSGGAFAQPALADIAGHGVIARATVTNVAHRHLARDLQSLARTLEAAGGCGIRLARNGLAHPFDRWRAFLAEPAPVGLVQALVVQVPDDDAERVTTFGLNQFGLPDGAIETDDVDADEAAATLFAFSCWLVSDRPRLRDGQGFSAGDGARAWRLLHEPDDRYAATDPFFNPAGIWCLSDPDVEIE